MARKQRQGYWVRGHFVAAGSELDLELKRELKGDQDYSRNDAKRDSDAKQQLGEDLLGLGANARAQLNLPEALIVALNDAKKIDSHGARRRQMQYIGKLMRKLDEDTLQAVQAALLAQHQGTAEQAQALHEAEDWRDRLIDSDEAVTQWLANHRETDAQALRSLIRQARKDAKPTKAGETPRHGRAYREIFQLVKLTLQAQQKAAATAEDEDDEE
jgi:ribosome-associated protein